MTDSAWMFECHSASVWEDSPDNVEGHSWSSFLERELHLSWPAIIYDYTGRDMTHFSDRLIALSSAMQRLPERIGWTPVYGLWRENIIENLCRYIYKHAARIARQVLTIPEEYVAPTWS
jgi:hypothetical protein